MKYKPQMTAIASVNTFMWLIVAGRLARDGHSSPGGVDILSAIFVGFGLLWSIGLYFASKKVVQKTQDVQPPPPSK